MEPLRAQQPQRLVVAGGRHLGKRRKQLEEVVALRKLTARELADDE